MNKQPTSGQKIGAYLMFFLSMAIFIIMGVIGILVLSWLLIVAAIVGFVIFVIAYIRARFLAKKMYINQPSSTLHKPSGKVYDHDEFK